MQSWLKTEFASAQKEARRLKAPLWFVTNRDVKALPLPAPLKESVARQLWMAFDGRGEFRFMFAGTGKMAGTVHVFIRRLLADKPRPELLVMDTPQPSIVLRAR